MIEVAYHRYIGAGRVERFQRRCAYGGKKGRAAARRLRAMSRQWVTDRALCAAFFKEIDSRGGRA
jgi:hypothetical protein